MRFDAYLFLSFCFFVSGCAGVLNTGPQKVELMHHSPGQWTLEVNGQPYFVKGVVYNFSVVGDDPDLGTLRDWSILDLDQNGKIDTAYDAWVDKNLNNFQDADEPKKGDWQLLKEMGCNTLRIYQMPSNDKRIRDLYIYPGVRLTFLHLPNKALFRDLYETYGISVIVGHFFGEWTIGSHAEWEKGTDYTDPDQRKNLLTCIRVMVEEHKDEPYTLMWMIGNENFNPYDHDNAEEQVEAFLTLVNEAAELIHSLDPYHPVALCNFNMTNLDQIAKWCPAIDVFGMNNYSNGFQTDWERVREVYDRPVLITEYGFQAKLRYYYDEGAQARYHKICWTDIEKNRYGGPGIGNSIGGMVFSWCDQWHLGGDPFLHDNGAFLGVAGSEWYGVTSQGDGAHSPFLRQLRRSYDYYKSVWPLN